MAPTLHDTYSGRIAAGERLTREDIDQLAGTYDILGVGMLADEARRRTYGTRVTFVRVASCAHDKPLAEAVPPAAREVRLTGTPASVEVAVTAVEAARAVAGDRRLSAFSVVDLHALAAADGGALSMLLRRLREAGLDAPAEIPVDMLAHPEAVLDALASAGYSAVRLTVAKPAAAERVPALLRAAALRDAYSIVQTISPLAMTLPAFRPTTGYEDVKAVALARLAAAAETHIQVDWQRYGPKLAQVALTFGADDVDNVSASDLAPDGRRRAPLEELRRNIEAAGFVAEERSS